MLLLCKRTAATIVALACSQWGLAQAITHTILEIDVENSVQYFEDTSDLSKLATDPGVTTPNPAKNFGKAFEIDDIVAVNGQPAKGTVLLSWRTMTLGTTGAPAAAIADITRNNTIDVRIELLKSDGTPVGTIIASGLGAGPPPPGAPQAVVQGNNAITGGTGAFLGARGQAEQGVIAVAKRQASMTEDPANRRRNGGGKVRFVLDVIPMSVPQIVSTAGGPAVTHSNDFSLVTASKPAAAGEILSLFMTGLGPTRPGVDPGKPFPGSPAAVVNSPIQITVNGEVAQVTGAVGYPGAVDAYQVNFQVPPSTTKGPATIQVSAAWISGPPVTIQVQ